jgi:ArsR family transcriptional regulator
MDLPQTVVSHHLKVLKYAGIISDRRWSRWMIYSLVDKRALTAIEITSPGADRK